MIRAARPSREELVSRYGLSERLSVRILALASKGLGVTGAVLEEAARVPSIVETILAPEILELGSGLDTASVRRIGPGGKSLAVVSKILCLQEEVQAEEPSPGESKLPSAPRRRTSAIAPATGGLDADEVRRAFPAEEIARLKLVLLTAVYSSAKVEALRRLALAPIANEEKGILALRAIADPSPDVRREAAQVLERMGLDPELADALRSASTGSARQKEVALRRIAQLGRAAGATEQSVAVAALVSALEYEKETDVLKEILAALTAFAGPIAARPETVAGLARQLVRLLAESFAAVSSQARILLDELGSIRKSDVPAILWKEVEGAGDRRLRTFFLEALFAHPLPKELDRTLCRLAAADLSVRPLEDLESRRLADALRLRGNIALEALLEVVPDLKEEARALLLPVLDTVAGGPDIQARLRNRTAEYLLQELREGSRPLRTGILEARLVAHPDLDPALKRKFAADFIANLHAYKAPRMHDLTAGAIRRIGVAAEESLVQAIRKSSHAEELEMAARLLAEIAEEEKVDGDTVSRIVGFLRSQETGQRIGFGLAVKSSGRAASGPAAPPELVASLLVEYGARLGNNPYGTDLVSSLGWLAASPSADPARASDVALKYMDLLDSPMPDVQMDETKGDDGVHLILGVQTGVYTDLIPELLSGLRRIFVAGRIAPGVRSRIAERLCVRYAAVTEYREVWAPGNLGELGELLGVAASAPGTDPASRLRIIQALRANLRNLGTVRVLAEVFSRTDEDERGYLEALEEFAGEVLSYLDRPEYREREDQRILVEGLGRIAGNRRLAADRAESERRRERIVEMLLEHAGWMREARPLLRALAENGNLPKALRARAARAGP
ncbi:MAG TPA: hypothetical protein VJU16_04705 [Planctomycetota bacterium]|nr:hypothetical protein [Planctomycetota bacterium]